MANAVSKVVFVVAILGMLIVGLVIGFDVSSTVRNDILSTSATSATNSSKTMQSSSRSTSTVYTAGSSEYALSATDQITLGWTLEGQYSGTTQYNDANLFVLVVTNTGQNSLTSVSYTVQGALGPFQNDTTLAPGSSETFQVTFVGDLQYPVQCGMTSEGFCTQQVSLTVNPKFSDGASYSIPQEIDVVYGTVSPYMYNTNSSFCTQLISSFNGVSASYTSGYLTVTGNSSIQNVGVAAYTIFDPLNSNGLHVTGISQLAWQNGMPINIGSPNFISGKDYNLWLQVGKLMAIPDLNEPDETYALGGFCTLSLSFQA